jgi:hypothetical protein
MDPSDLISLGKRRAQAAQALLERAVEASSQAKLPQGDQEIQGLLKRLEDLLKSQMEMCAAGTREARFCL